MAGIYHPSRGGTRGGQDQFNWGDVKSDKDREYYIGHSLMVPTGSHTKGKDIFWYTRNKADTSDVDNARTEEIRRVKELEARAMAAVLGKKTFTIEETLSKEDMKEALSRGKTEQTNHANKIHGMGYKRPPTDSKDLKYGTQFEGFDERREEVNGEEIIKKKSNSKKKKKEKKKKQKKYSDSDSDTSTNLKGSEKYRSQLSVDHRRNFRQQIGESSCVKPSRNFETDRQQVIKNRKDSSDSCKLKSSERYRNRSISIDSVEKHNQTNKQNHRNRGNRRESNEHRRRSVSKDLNEPVKQTNKRNHRASSYSRNTDEPRKKKTNRRTHTNRSNSRDLNESRKQATSRSHGASSQSRNSDEPRRKINKRNNRARARSHSKDSDGLRQKSNTGRFRKRSSSRES